MRKLLAAAAMTGLATSAAYAQCGHPTTAQSKPPVIVAQNATPTTGTASTLVDETLTGSTADAVTVEKPLAGSTESE